MTKRIPKIGDKIHRVKGMGLNLADWIDNAIVSYVDTVGGQVSVKKGPSTVAFSHFRNGTVEIIGKCNQKPISIITCNDDYYEVYNNKEKQDKIKELINDEKVDNDNIRIYPITNVQKVNCKVNIEKIN